MNVIGWLTKRHGTGKNVWLAVDKLLRADDEDVDVKVMDDILREFRAQQLARKVGCLGDEMVILAALEIGDRARMRLWNGIEKCSRVGDKEQTHLRIRWWVETKLEGMFEQHCTAGDKEQVKLRIVRWMGKPPEKEFGRICGSSGSQ